MRGPLAGRATCLGAVVALAAVACSSGGGDTAEPTRTPAAGTSSSGSASSTHPGTGRPDPDGRIVFGRITRVDDGYGQVVALYAIDPDGSDEVQLTKGESAYPEWSPQGDRIAYTVGLADGSWQVATMAPDGSDVRVLTSGPGEHGSPAWTPDGSSLVYVHSPIVAGSGYRTTIWLMKADGSQQKRIGNPDTWDIEPKVSPDGTSVLFVRVTQAGQKLTTSLMVRDLSTGKERALPAAGTWPEHADWARDGMSIVYNVWAGITDTVPHDQVERVPADGSGTPTVLFPATASRGGFKPKFSPDGTRLVLGCVGVVTGKDDAACTMDADGSNVRILVDSPSRDENHFDWGPVPP
ncbi:TolB family protein [Knoellia sp. CPCC 206450]|uniref:TolB family protein n=1 Tax=Knoellia tibetensis TaxID=3404798 RepID=UPI003B42AA08